MTNSEPGEGSTCKTLGKILRDIQGMKGGQCGKRMHEAKCDLGWGRETEYEGTYRLCVWYFILP